MAADRPPWVDPVIKIVCDLLSLFLVFLPWIVLHAAVYPFKRGFFCDDQSLMHPYHPSTITTLVLVIVGIGLPVFVMIVTETVDFFLRKQKSGQVDYRYIGKFKVHPILWDCYVTIGIFLFGCAVQQTITNIGKYAVGRLRPHFFSVCLPDYSKFNCTDSRGVYRYVMDDSVCTGTDQKLLKEMRMSFPSGHASMSMYCAAYLVLYLHSRLLWKGSKLLRPFLQTVVLYMGIATCVSRISDYKHHWSDVLIGGLLGVGTAVITAVYISGLFKVPTLSDIAKAVKDMRDEQTDRKEYGFSRSEKTPVPNYGSNNTVSVEIEHANNVPASEGISL